MEPSKAQIRQFRLRAHHLDRRLPAGGLLDAAGACGLQNSPPGAWETALFQRLEGCTLPRLRDALYRDKALLQAWSFRGAPVVFPADEGGVFLTPLAARDGEEPWIYTMGVAGALEFLQMPFDGLLRRTAEAARWLDSHTVWGKDALDRTLADLIEPGLPEGKRALWRAPSMYGSPDSQTVGGAVVSFLLRPCAFRSLVVFGGREGATPSFTSFRNWMGRVPEGGAGTDRALARKFLHCYGPAAPDALAAWLGCSRRQARRIWDAGADGYAAVAVGGKTRYVLEEDLGSLFCAPEAPGRLLLLGAHDPYLDVRDRDVLLESPSLQRQVWKTVGNPGAVLKDGRVVGVWRGKARSGRLDVTISPFEALTPPERLALEGLAAEYAAFRGLALHGFGIGGLP